MCPPKGENGCETLTNYNLVLTFPRNLRYEWFFVPLVTGYWPKTGAETLLRHLPPLAQILLREILQQTLQYQQQRRAMLPSCCCCYNVISRELFQKRNDRFIDLRTEWLFWNNREYILIPEGGQSNAT